MSLFSSTCSINKNTVLIRSVFFDGFLCWMLVLGNSLAGSQYLAWFGTIDWVDLVLSSHGCDVFLGWVEFL